MKISPFKLLAAFATIAGIVGCYVGKLLEPSHMLLEGPPPPPEWISWWALHLASLGALAYIILDLRSKKD